MDDANIDPPRFWRMLVYSGRKRELYLSSAMRRRRVRGWCSGLQNQLQLKGLRSHYRNTDKPASQIARELDVEFVLTGSVRVAAGRLRITTQLVEAATDRAIWADRTDGTLDDIFDIQ